MKCKFCAEEIDSWGSVEKSCCSWCMQEQPLHNHVCWVCESPIDFEDGFAFCNVCGKDYLTKQEREEVDMLHADFLKGCAERMEYV